MPRLRDTLGSVSHRGRSGVVRFIIDAQLPRRLAIWLCQVGHVATHTSDMPAGNQSSDEAICERADEDDAVVVTKDSDFVVSRTLRGRPRRLLVVATGNITNDALMRLFETNLATIVGALASPAQVELGSATLVIRD